MRMYLRYGSCFRSGLKGAGDVVVHFLKEHCLSGPFTARFKLAYNALRDTMCGKEASRYEKAGSFQRSYHVVLNGRGYVKAKYTFVDRVQIISSRIMSS